MCSLKLRSNSHFFNPSLPLNFTICSKLSVHSKYRLLGCSEDKRPPPKPFKCDNLSLHTLWMGKSFIVSVLLFISMCCWRFSALPVSAQSVLTLFCIFNKMKEERWMQTLKEPLDWQVIKRVALPVEQCQEFCKSQNEDWLLKKLFIFRGTFLTFFLYFRQLNKRTKSAYWHCYRSPPVLFLEGTFPQTTEREK